MSVESIERVAEAARARGLSVAVAESLTCGLVASAVGEGPETEDWFAGAVVAYQTRVKESVLGVRPGIDPVSADCAEQLASGALALLGADVAVSTTGVGGPGPEGGHPAGTVYLGWATRAATGHVRLAIDGDTDAILDRTVTEAVTLLEKLVARS